MESVALNSWQIVADTAPPWCFSVFSIFMIGRFHEKAKVGCVRYEDFGLQNGTNVSHHRQLKGEAISLAYHAIT